jgi:hypothetical protein
LYVFTLKFTRFCASETDLKEFEDAKRVKAVNQRRTDNTIWPKEKRTNNDLQNTYTENIKIEQHKIH